MTPTEAYTIIKELREADYAKAGNEFFAERTARLQAAGWVLGVVAYPHKATRGRRGHPLSTPKNEWRNIAHWYHVESRTKIWYWNNFGYSKYQAELFAKDNPPPVGNFTFLDSFTAAGATR